MKYSSFAAICIFVLLYVSVATSQHTTSVRFSPVPQPTASGIACIQMVCPTDSLQPSCPSDCASGCKYVPDQCCPQVTVAVCESTPTASSSSTNGVSSSAASPSLSTTTITASLPTLPSSSSPSTASPKTNSGAYFRPTVYSSLVLMILIGVIIA